MPTSQILYFKKRQHGLLQSDGNKTALQQSLSLSAEMKRNTYQGLRRNTIWTGRGQEKALVEKGGSVLTRHVVR